MGKAKEIQVRVIEAKVANQFVRANHYSGKNATSTRLSMGCFIGGRMHGVMQFGSPIDRRKLIGLVHTSAGVPVLWNEFIELNRMAFSEAMPRNSESRCLAIAFRLIRKNAPHVKWVVSFADATQCGDGAIYRATGFKLTAIRESKDDLWRTPEHLGWGGMVSHRIAIQGSTGRVADWVLRTYGTRNVAIKRLVAEHGGEALSGFQLRYIYLLDRTCRLAVPEIPYAAIDAAGAGMYRGVAQTRASRNIPKPPPTHGPR